MDALDFYRGKRVLVTGHTGFKGAWLCTLMLMAGAEVTGYALEPNTRPNAFEALGVERHIHSVIADVRDFDALKRAFDEANPEIVFHLAAQPIVRESYRAPRYTFDTNVMGTVNALECARLNGAARSFLCVTTDKVYENREWLWGYRENEPLNGYDPYSSSKSCADLATQCYGRLLGRAGTAVSTARAGNVIGGGDFAADRIIPDCVRAARENRPIQIRNPRSVRPYQHVLEPLAAYLLIAQKQAETPSFAGAYNVGPDQRDCLTTGALADCFCRAWGEGARWEAREEPNAPHEANFLRLDCAKIRQTLGWKPVWRAEKAVSATVQWTKAYFTGENAGDVARAQISDYLKESAEINHV